MQLYKFLSERGRSVNGGDAQWHLPIKLSDGTWKPGEWMPPIEGKLVLCENGYHLCHAKDLLSWCASTLWIAETKGKLLEGNDKMVAREARLLSRVEIWNDRTARLLACDCAEHVLPIYEKQYPNDKRPRSCIETARRFARGEATLEQLAAAGDVAMAGAAARAGERSWQTERLCEVLGIPGGK